MYLFLATFFLICLIKLARLPPNSVTVCALVHVILTLETLKFDKRWRNVFWRSIRKKIKISPKRSCVNVIFLTSPTPLYYLLLLNASFWTEFSEHVFTLNLASIALNMHIEGSGRKGRISFFTFFSGEQFEFLA